MRYITVRDKTSYQQLTGTLHLNNLFHNKFNTAVTQHQIAIQGLKCRAWVRNFKDGDFPNLLMWHILLYRNIAISYLNIDIRIVGKNIVVNRYIGVSLQP